VNFEFHQEAFSDYSSEKNQREELKKLK